MNWKELFEVVGLVAIVASLIFVGIQLRQEHVIARTELATGTSDFLVRIDEMISEPELAAAYAKMLSAPDELSLAEKVQLNGLLGMVTEVFRRDCYIKARGIFEECSDVIHYLLPFYFGNEYSQRWWRINKPNSIYALPAWVDDEIAGLEKDTTLRRLNEIQISQ